MTRVVFATPNQGRQADMQRLLADLDVVLSRVGPPVPAGLDLEATARLRARLAFAALGERCFVENTSFEIEGEAPLRGADLKARLVALGDDGFCAAFADRAATARVVVALAEADHDDGVRLFTGELHGTIPSAPRGEGGHGWDRVFVPDGYRRSLAELGASTYLVNMRHAPYLDLADHLRGRQYGGAFEAHVTVRTAADGADRFAAVCDELAVKCVMIELPAGETVAQPMTASVHRGTLREAQDEVHDLARALVGHGFEVVRTKLEALPRNADIPEDDAAAARTPRGYFEFHLKVVVPPGGDLDAVRAAVAPHGARLSRNAASRRADGSEERYVTLRVPGLGRPAADARFAALQAAVAPLPVAITRRIREYVVYDSNVVLDRGWL